MFNRMSNRDGRRLHPDSHSRDEQLDADPGTIVWTGPSSKITSFRSHSTQVLRPPSSSRFWPCSGSGGNQYLPNCGGSIADKSPDRRQKQGGFEKWDSQLAIEGLPGILRLALLLLGCALLPNLWTIDHTVAGIVVACSALRGHPIFHPQSRSRTSFHIPIPGTSFHSHSNHHRIPIA